MSVEEAILNILNERIALRKGELINILTSKGFKRSRIEKAFKNLVSEGRIKYLRGYWIAYLPEREKVINTLIEVIRRYKRRISLRLIIKVLEDLGVVKTISKPVFDVDEIIKVYEELLNEGYPPYPSDADIFVRIYCRREFEKFREWLSKLKHSKVKVSQDRGCYVVYVESGGE